MAKFAGLVGYVTQEETRPGIWSPVVNPVMMVGDVIRLSSSVQNGDKVNNDIALNHRVSLIGDTYALTNYHNIRWIELNNCKWEVTSVEIQRPRVIVTLGGVWSGK